MGKRSLSEVAEEPAWPQIDRQPLQFLMGGQVGLAATLHVVQASAY